MGDGLVVWDGNAIKLGCDDRCTTINVTKFIELKKKKRSGRKCNHENPENGAQRTMCHTPKFVDSLGEVLILFF